MAEVWAEDEAEQQMPNQDKYLRIFTQDENIIYCGKVTIHIECLLHSAQITRDPQCYASPQQVTTLRKGAM